MDTYKVGKIEAICLIAIIMLNHIILNLPKTLLISTGSSAILNTIYVAFLIILLIFIITKLWRYFPDKDILDIGEFLGGKKLKIFLGILFFLFFLYISAIFLRSFTTTIKIIYFEYFPVSILAILLLAGAYLVNKLGTKAVIRTNLLTVPIVAIAIFIVCISGINKFTYQRIFPILGYGAESTFLSGISNIFAFSGIAILYFLPPMLEKKKDFKKISLISITIVSILLILSVATLLFTFSFMTKTQELTSLYMEIRGNNYGSLFERADALFIFFWILAIISYLSVTLLFLSHIFKKIIPIQDKRGILLLLCNLVLACSLIPSNIAQIRFAEITIIRYFSLILLYGISIPILILANRKAKKKKGSIVYKKEEEIPDV